MDKELIGWAFNLLFAVLGFGGAFVINRLAKSIDSLVLSDTDLRNLIILHREDVIKNYVTHEGVAAIKAEMHQQSSDYKKEIIGRVDRLEMAFKDALMAHEHREQTAYSNLVQIIKKEAS